MDIDNLLQRNILGGQEYEPLFPEVSCDKTNLGNGNTFDTVRMIKQMVIKYNHQTKEVAKGLQQTTLKETCDRIYWFLYELIYQHKLTTIEEAKLVVFEYIEVWYNRKRLHSSLGYKTPKVMELEFYKIESVA